MRKSSQRKSNLQGRIESLEERVVMSADPLADLLGGAIEHHSFDDGPELVHHATDSTGSLSAPDALPPLSQHIEDQTPDFWITEEDRALLEDQLDEIEQMLSSAHQLTGWNSVQTNYGFDGTGQTVAVIDSGIAYDHYALGGGYGSNYRVVGGWDFTGENDADPYDDGTAGKHGSHVTGIIGSSDSTHHGVASGVDFVGLRVFDDAGAGYFSWVENALRWIHDNRNAFDNPITTVNLSLGVSSWNSESIPSWANLEDEFAQLEADGIFIAVSAGNSFTSYNTTGLSYPAASPYVVPVMSVDDSGALSYFSQRSTRAIAGPGRSITSTVPDYAGNNDGLANDFRTMSGTSMASPYVAGSSVLIREAMELVGMTGITQDTIYDHMMATADSFVDSATGATFQRLNLQNAIDALMPADDFGSSMVDAYNMGSLSAGTMSGMISTLSDVDYFTFTAASTGTATFATTSTTHNMAAQWTAYNGQGVSVLAGGGASASFAVVAGQSYTVGLSSSDGLGNYSFDASIAADSSPAPEDWGVVTFNQHADQSVAGENWYRVSASQTGYFTALADFSAGGAVTLEIYDTQQNLISAGNVAGTTARVDVDAAAGQSFLLRIQGTSGDVDVTLANLVVHAGTTVTVAGAAGDDEVTFSAGSSFYLTVNGIGYGFSTSEASEFQLRGGEGANSVTLYGAATDDIAIMLAGNTDLTGANYAVSAVGFGTATVHGGGGNDRAYLFDTAGDDEFVGTSDIRRMEGAGYQNTVQAFDRVDAYATAGGNDQAYLYDTAGNDQFFGKSEFSWMQGAGYLNFVKSFDRVEAYSTAGGSDRAYLYDSAGDDTFVGRSDSSWLEGGNFFNYAEGFDRVDAYATAGGYDQARMYDSAGNDQFYGKSEFSWMQGSGYLTFAQGFTRVDGYSTAGGNDRAYLFDTAGDDYFVYYGESDYGRMNSTYARGFSRLDAIATAGGLDRAILYDSAGDDRFYSKSEFSWIQGAGYLAFTQGFDQVEGNAAVGGNDRAFMYDTAGDDLFYGTSDLSRMQGAGYVNYARNFDRVDGYATAGGNDRAYLYDTAGDDRFYGKSEFSWMQGSGYLLFAQGFDRVDGYALAGGADRAFFYDTAGDDQFYGKSDFSWMQGAGYLNFAQGFDRVDAYATSGGNDTALLWDTVGNDQFFGKSDFSWMQGSGFLNFAQGFDLVEATFSSGNDSATLFDVAAADTLSGSGSAASLDRAVGGDANVDGMDNLTAISRSGETSSHSVGATDYAFATVGSWS
ncbi:MAG: hypothetical protein CMJ58_19465 [Planctomycetaceae bacterium]|nr:hypothetical protein [Planctomycetaceae bacterium]